MKSSTDDCESMSYLAQIDSQERHWHPALDRFVTAAACCDRVLTGLVTSPGTSANSPGAEARNAASAAEIARLEALQSSSIYNAAIAAKVLGRREAALEYARRLLADPEYRQRARDFILDIDVPARVGGEVTYAHVERELGTSQNASAIDERLLRPAPARTTRGPGR